MKTPAPLSAALTMDAGGNITSPAWREHFTAQNNHYEQVDRWVDPTHHDFGKVEPTANVKRPGLRAYADGVNWNPKGDGTAGYFYWTGSAWAQ